MLDVAECAASSRSSGRRRSPAWAARRRHRGAAAWVLARGPRAHPRRRPICPGGRVWHAIAARMATIHRLQPRCRLSRAVPLQSDHCRDSRTLGSLARSVAAEYGRHGIRMNAVACARAWRSSAICARMRRSKSGTRFDCFSCRCTRFGLAVSQRERPVGRRGQPRWSGH